MAQLHTESSGPFFAQLGIGSTGTIFDNYILGHWERRLLNRTLGHPDRSLLGQGCNDGEHSFTVAALKTRSKSSPTRPGSQAYLAEISGQAVRSTRSPYTKTPWHSGQGEKKKRVGAAVY